MSQSSKCTKCGGLQGREVWFDMYSGEEVPQLRCINCGKIEQLISDGAGWKKYDATKVNIETYNFTKEGEWV